MATALFAVATASAEIINFEGAVADHVTGIHVEQGYKGFDWTGGLGNSSWVLVTAGDGQDHFSAHSGNQYVWSDTGTPLTLSNSSAFDLNSLWIEASSTSSKTEVAEGFLNGVQIYSKTFTVDDNYTELDLNFAGIDTLTLSPTGSDGVLFNVVIDDINVTTGVTPSVPDGGATSSMLGVALAAIGAVRRKLR